MDLVGYIFPKSKRITDPFLSTYQTSHYSKSASFIPALHSKLFPSQHSFQDGSQLPREWGSEATRLRENIILTKMLALRK